MWEQTLETNSVKLGNGVIIRPLWVKYGGKIACQPPSAQNPGHAPANATSNLFLTNSVAKILSGTRELTSKLFGKKES